MSKWLRYALVYGPPLGVVGAVTAMGKVQEWGWGEIVIVGALLGGFATAVDQALRKVW